MCIANIIKHKVHEIEDKTGMRARIKGTADDIIFYHPKSLGWALIYKESSICMSSQLNYLYLEYWTEVLQG